METTKVTEDVTRKLRETAHLLCKGESASDRKAYCILQTLITKERKGMPGSLVLSIVNIQKQINKGQFCNAYASAVELSHNPMSIIR